MDKEKKNQVSIIVKYVSGNYYEEFNMHQKVQHLYDNAIKFFLIDKISEGKLELFMNGNVLDKNLTIEQAGINDGTTLILSTVSSDDIEGI